MGGGPKDIDKTPDKPFSPSDSHKVTQAKPAQTTPEGMTPDESTVLDLAPTWGRWSQIFYPADKALDPAPVGTVAEVYRDIAGILKAGFTDMDNGMKTILADQWSGAGADAAQQVTQAYVANGDALHAAVMGMNVNLVNLSDVVSVTKSNLPHPDDVKSYLETAVNDAIKSANRQGHITVTTPDSQDPQFTLTGNVQYSRAGGHTSVTAAQIQPLFDEALRSVDEVAQNTMSSSFYPGLQASDRGVPAYAIAPPNTSAPPSAPPGGPGSGGAGGGGGGGTPPSFSGGGGGGLGGGGGDSGGGGAPPSAADVAAQTRQLLETGGPGGNPAGPMPTGVDPMGGGANAPGGSGAMPMPGAGGGVPGMSGASGASDAMKKAMSQGAALAGLPSPAGLSGLQSKLGGLGKPGEIPALKGLSGLPHGAGAGGGGAGGGGAGGGGAGAGGGGAAGPLGAPKAMSDAATREASISQGLRESAAAERGAATAARAGSAAAPAGGGAPMGGGGGARGGGGGEDKEHKTNKFLRSTRRGEDLLGQAPPATAAVIGPQ